jgi:hypothetical protein
MLRAGGDTAVAAGRDPARADRVIDLSEPGHRSLLPALHDIDVVVNAAGVEDPTLVAAITGRGVAFVDITATTAYVAALEALEPPAPVLLSVGLAPGLTNLLATAVHERSPGPIDIAVVLGAGERHGAAGTAWAFGLLGRHFSEPADGRRLRNYTGGTSFPLFRWGTRRLYRADFSDQHVLTRDLGVPVRTYFGLDSRLATAALAVLTRVPGGSRAPQGLHVPGSDRWMALARTPDTEVWARGRRQSRATAAMAVAAARRVVRLPPGVHHLHDVMRLADLPPDTGIETSVPPALAPPVDPTGGTPPHRADWRCG